MALTLNDKIKIVFDAVEHELNKNSKHMSIMLRSVYKPMCATIRSFCYTTPESQLQDAWNKANMMLDAMQCQYETEDEFKAHIAELFSAWI